MNIIRLALITGMVFSLVGNNLKSLQDGVLGCLPSEITVINEITSSDFTSIYPVLGEWTLFRTGPGAIEYQINWQPVNGADGYEFYYDFEITSLSEQMVDTPGTAYTVGFQNTVNLKGKVRAYKKVNNQKVYTQWSNVSYKDWDTIDREVKSHNDSELGTYISDYGMHLRSEPNKDSSVVGDINAGDTVNIFEIKKYWDENWGKTSDGKWICISDKDYTYLTKQKSQSDNSDTGTYRTNYEMTLRSQPNRNSSSYGVIEKGSTVNIVDIENNGDGKWGKTSDGKWVCISDRDNTYLAKQ